MRLSLMLALGALTLSATAWADQVYVEPATGSGVTDSDLTTARTLIVSSIGDVSKDTVIDAPQGADYVLRPTLVRLGQAYLLGLSKVRDGKIVASSQLKAAQMEELDKVAERLTRSVLLGEVAKANPRVGEITDQEAKDGAQRRPTRGENYFSFGGCVLSNLGANGIGYSVGFGKAWDVNVALIKIEGEVNFNDTAWMASGGIGVKYFFLTTDFAPYVTGDFGAGAAKIDANEGWLNGQTVGGFDVGGGVGAQFLRTASVNLDLGFRVGAILNSTIYGDPIVYSLRLGIYF